MWRSGRDNAKSFRTRARAKRLSIWRLGAPARRVGATVTVRGFAGWLRLCRLGFEGRGLTLKVRELPDWLGVLEFDFPTAVGESVTDVVRGLPGWLDVFGLEFAIRLDLVTEVRGPRGCSCTTERRAAIVCGEWWETEKRGQ